MHKAISIIIIAKNEAHIIERTLKALKNMSDDIIVIENNSTDNTANIAVANGAKVVQQEWLGYGATKNYGHSIAKHNWICSLDADEIADETLWQAINNINFENLNINTVFEMTRKLVWNDTVLHYGQSKEKKIRIFNKTNASWNNQLAHESLVFKNKNITVQKLAGTLLHYCYKNEADALEKFDKYAQVMAQQKYNSGAKTSFLKAKFAGHINYWKSYILKSAWRDGAPGLEYAQLFKNYTFKKYYYLWELNHKDLKNEKRH
jgi:glycosyltransferase involved in cell wall biosynthesis